jgi:hypothetical protein
VTPAEIIYHRRVRVLEYAMQTGNVAARAGRSGCPEPGSMRGLDALMPKGRRAEIDNWLIRYNTRRRNHSDYMRGRTPLEILDTHHNSKAA